MYRVYIQVQISDPSRPEDKYKKAAYEGVFLPKEKTSRVTKNKVARQIEKTIIPPLKKSNPHLEFTFKIVTVEKICEDFIIKEE